MLYATGMHRAAAVEKKKLCSAATAEDCNTMPEYRILVVQYTVGA